MPAKKKKPKKKTKAKITEHAEVVRAIELAASKGNVRDMMQYLQPTGGPKMRKYNPKGKAGNALAKACQYGQKECAEWLVNCGCPIDWGSGKPLQLACRSGRMDMVQWLVDRKADVNSQAEFTHISPLMYAAREGKIDLVEYLLEKGARADQRCNERNCGYQNGWGAMHFAANSENEEVSRQICELLWEKGRGTLDLPSAQGDTPMGIAAESGRMRLVQWFVKNGAAINAKRRGMNATQWAIYRAEHKTVQFLVSYGGLPNLNSQVLWFDPAQTLLEKISEEDEKIVKMIDLAIYRGRQALRKRAAFIRQVCQVEWEMLAAYDPISVDDVPDSLATRFDSRAIQEITQFLEDPLSEDDLFAEEPDFEAEPSSESDEM